MKDFFEKKYIKQLDIHRFRAARCGVPKNLTPTCEVENLG